VQISVVVVSFKKRALKAEVEKGFVRTAVGHELIDPKAEINLAKVGTFDRVLSLSGERSGHLG